MSQWLAVLSMRRRAVRESAWRQVGPAVPVQTRSPGLAAIDDGRPAKPRPFLPCGVSDAVGWWTVGIAAAALGAAAGGQHQDKQKDCWQPGTERVGGTQDGRLPANTNIDEGAVEIHV